MNGRGDGDYQTWIIFTKSNALSLKYTKSRFADKFLHFKWQRLVSMQSVLKKTRFENASQIIRKKTRVESLQEGQTFVHKKMAQQ